MQKIQKRLKEKFGHNGVTLQSIAVQLGMSEASLKNILLGKAAMKPLPATVQAIAKALGEDPTELLPYLDSIPRIDREARLWRTRKEKVDKKMYLHAMELVVKVLDKYGENILTKEKLLYLTNEVFEYLQVARGNEASLQSQLQVVEWVIERDGI